MKKSTIVTTCGAIALFTSFTAFAAATSQEKDSMEGYLYNNAKVTVVSNTSLPHPCNVDMASTLQPGEQHSPYYVSLQDNESYCNVKFIIQTSPAKECIFSFIPPATLSMEGSLDNCDYAGTNIYFND